jgi:tRNA A37 methylthiotransferase MiaB
MSQRFAKELRHQLPEVDAFIGLDQVSQLGEIVEKILRKRPTLNAQRSTLNSDGCQSWMLGDGCWLLDVCFIFPNYPLSWSY